MGSPLLSAFLVSRLLHDWCAYGLFCAFRESAKRIARWFGWTGLATIAGMIALALEALQGPAALNLTSALLYGFFSAARQWAH